MKKELGERLLAKLMSWTDAEKAAERARLEAFASYKYDEYQQFAPGRRFIESLALWLRQFKPGEERLIAYEFVRSRLVFISNDEMNYLVGLVFPTVLRGRLLYDTAAAQSELGAYQIKALARAPDYRSRLRRTLVLGLSDGARTDRFRRANPRDITNEQVFHAYDISDEKVESLTGKLRKDLAHLLGRPATDDEARFQYVVLLDDFSASGTSAIRRENGAWDGKIPRIIQQLENDGSLSQAIATSGVKVMIVIYVASEQAIAHIKRELGELTFSKGVVTLDVIHRLCPRTRLDDVRDAKILKLASKDQYFDEAVDDEHAAVGGTSKRLGYADGRLPLVLSHNTPNNSIYLLWAEGVEKVLGLFPRVDRHRKRQ